MPVDDLALDRRILTLWRLRAAAIGLVIAIVALIIELATGPDDLPWPVGSGAVAVIVVVGGTGLAVAELGYRYWRYALADDALELQHGVLRRQRSIIPYHRVQHLDLESGPIERWLGLTSLVVRTASATTDGSIPGLSEEVAADLRTRILGRAEDDDGV